LKQTYKVALIPSLMKHDETRSTIQHCGQECKDGSKLASETKQSSNRHSRERRREESSPHSEHIEPCMDERKRRKKR